MQAQRPPWSSTTKLTVLLLLLGLAIYLLSQLRVILIPLVLAIILAYVLTPLVNRFEQRLGLRRALASLLAYLVALVSLGIVPAVLIPALSAQSADFNASLQNILKDVEQLLGSPYTVLGQTINPQALMEEAAGSLNSLLEPVFGQTLELIIGAISSIAWVIFILVVAFYLLKDAPSIGAWLVDLVPPAYRDDYVRLRDEILCIWAAFFRGQITLAIVVAIFFSIAGLILGIPFALVMGTLAGLLEFLPSIGHGIWLALAVLLALFSGSTWLPLPPWAFALLITGLHLVYQQFDLNYLIPRIVGRRVHLPPLVVILGIVSGALLAGVLGVLLAAPTIASLRVVGRYLYANLIDTAQIPNSTLSQLPPPNPRWWRRRVPASKPENQIQTE